MPIDIHELLTTAAGAPPGPAPEAQILRRASARRIRRRATQATLSLLLVVGLGAAVMNQLTRPSVELGGPPAGSAEGVPACIARPNRRPGGGHGCTTSIDKTQGLVWRYPDDWFEQKTIRGDRLELRLRTVATLSTPHVKPPRTVRGHMKRCPVGIEALAAVENDGALIALQMARSSDARGFGPRPERFGAPGTPLQRPPASCAGSTVARYTFSEGGRDFRAYVILRPKASEVTRKTALAVLNTLRVIEPSG